MIGGRTVERRLTSAGVHLLLGGALLLLLGPFFWLVSTSAKPENAMFQMPPQWIPSPPTARHYIDAFTHFPMLRFTGNTLIILVLSTLGTVISCSMAAYACSRLRWPDRGLVFGLLLTTMMVPAQITMIPVFVVFSKLSWIDTFMPLIVPAFFGNAFFIFLLRQFFMTIPEDLLEAARLDGAGEWRIFWTIVLPLAKPALATVLIFSALGAWNDFMGPLIYLTSESNRTLALGLAHLQSMQGTEWGLLMAVAVVMMITAMALFFFFQRFFIEGIALTGTRV